MKEGIDLHCECGRVKRLIVRVEECAAEKVDAINLNQITIFLCVCGELPQFGWHDLYGYNLHCRECKRHTDWCVDKPAAVVAWNALIAEAS
ncbi:MAG: hypothetical protein PHU14_09060 [Methylovulum sp.]|nr:hypothetical protein [Methylovulum sp.]